MPHKSTLGNYKTVRTFAVRTGLPGINFARGSSQSRVRTSHAGVVGGAHVYKVNRLKLDSINELRRHSTLKLISETSSIDLKGFQGHLYISHFCVFY